MSTITRPVKKGVIPTIQSSDCNKHIAWIKSVFVAEEVEIYRSKDGENVKHCALLVNGGYLYLCDVSTSLEKDSLSEEPSKRLLLHVELEEPEAIWKNALNNEGMVVEDLKKQYWGGVYGSIRDPFGCTWGILKGGECCKDGVIPYLITEPGKCESYVEQLVQMFGGEVKDKFLSEESSLIQHCSVGINEGFVYLADDIRLPGQKPDPDDTKEELTPHVVCSIELSDPSQPWDRALEKGASVVVDMKVQYWGDLYGTVKDDKGFLWSLSKSSAPQKQAGSKARGVISYILSPDCEKHVEWIKSVLGGEVKDIRHTETNKIMHCLMEVNGGTLMLADRLDPTQSTTTTTSDDTPVTDNKGFVLHLNLAEPDDVWKKALSNGGVQLMELKKQFWGDYYGQFLDPFGYQWGVYKSVV